MTMPPPMRILLLALLLGPLLVPAFAHAQSTGPAAAAAEVDDVLNSNGDLAGLIAAAQEMELSAAEAGALTPSSAADLMSYFAAAGEVEVLSSLLSLGLAPDALNSRGTNALIAAVAADQLEAARLLMKAGASPATQTRDGTPADFARNVGTPEMAMLVAGEALPTNEDLLRRAARNNNVDEMARLQAAGADIDAADVEGVTALIEATVAGARDAIRYLADAGADPNAVTIDGNSAMGVAVTSGDEAIARLLLLSGARADGEVNGVPYLTLAAMTGDMEMVELLLRGGANRERMDNDGVRPAAVARILGYEDIAERLGGAPELDVPPDLVSLATNKTSQAFREALAAGADPNAVDAEGTPVAILVAADGSAEMLRQLHAAGANLAATGPEGNNILHAALVNPSVVQRPRIIAAALQLSGDGGHKLLAHRNAGGRSAFVAMAATLRGSEANLVGDRLLPTIVSSLAMAPDPDGVSPLVAAVVSDNGAFVEELVAKGAVVGRSGSEESLQDIARARGAWSALLALPDDRALPAGLKKGASRDVKVQLQQRLKDWGYYTGGIDGVFGAGSRAAMVAFLKDRAAELRRLPSADRRVSVFQGAATAENSTTYSLSFRPADGCIWKLVEWQAAPGSDRSTFFIGCVQGDSAWNANGVGYVEYEGGSSDLKLFGPQGWDGATDL